MIIEVYYDYFGVIECDIVKAHHHVITYHVIRKIYKSTINILINEYFDPFGYVQSNTVLYGVTVLAGIAGKRKTNL